MRKLVNPLPFLIDFIKCGIIGWCMEIIFTAAGALRRREMSLMGHTSIWMFPIYGCAAFLKPLFIVMRKCSLILRGLVYAVSIFTAEFASGRFLSKYSLCPWNYENHKWHIAGLVRLDYLPFWFVAGLLYERVLMKSSKLQLSLKQQ